MSLTAAGGFVVFLLSMQVAHSQRFWGVTYTSTHICALTGSTVEIHCTYRYPSATNPATVEKTFWFTRVSKHYHVPVDLRIDSDYADRVQYHCEDNNCMMRIRDLRESDSAEYKFRFITNQQGSSYTGSPGVTLSVRALHVQVSKLVHMGIARAELKCHSSCRLPDQTSYIWYKSGQKIQEVTSSHSGASQADSYACAVKGHEDFPSPSVCIDDQRCNIVMYTYRSICIFKGYSVDIPCWYSSYEAVQTRFWFRPDRSDQLEDLREDPQYAGRVQVLYSWKNNPTLRITDLRDSDSAEYRFKFKTGNFEWGSSLPGTTLTVTDPDLQVLLGTSWAQCHSRCQVPTNYYIWYKNGVKMREGSSYFSGYFDPAHSYACALKGHENFPSPLACVHGQTCNRVTYTDRSVCAPKGSSVDISCTYSSYRVPVESTFWFSPDRSAQWERSSQPEDLSEDYQYEGRVWVIETAGGRSSLRISDLRESDSADYYFKFKAGRFEWRSILPGTTLTVTALHVQVTRVTVHQYYTEAELKCHSSCSPAGHLSYVWFKNGKNIPNMENSSYKGWLYPGDDISCALKGHETHGSPSVYALRVPSVSVSLSGDIIEGSSLILTCSSDPNSPVKYTWYKTNVNLKPLSKERQLVFRSVQSSDSGEYYCTAENELGRRTSGNISIDVNYAPKTTSVSVSPSGEIVEGTSVNLTCSSDANPAANYTWYKENQTLLQGPEGIYHFNSVSSEDRGIYSCKSENRHGQLGSESVFIDVQYAPKLPSVSVSPSAKIVEGTSVNLTCSSDANPAASYTWYKEDEDSPKASGQIFTITDFRAEHSGNYYCEAQNRIGRHNSSLHLISLAGAWNSTPAGATTAFLLAVILLSVFIFMRKKRASEQTSEPWERPDHREQNLSTQRQADEGQDDLHYETVQFTEIHTDCLYSNFGPARPLRQQEEEDGSVEYTAIKFKSHRSQKSDWKVSAALYSKINRTR